jgi:hypothetical protein
MDFSSFQMIPNPRTKEEYIANGLIRGDTWFKIIMDVHVGADRINYVRSAMVNTGEILNPKKWGDHLYKQNHL